MAIFLRITATALRMSEIITCAFRPRQSSEVERSKVIQHYNMGPLSIVQPRELWRGLNAQVIISLILILMSICTTPFISLHACTGIKLKPSDGKVVHGRTLEFGIFIETSICVVPRGYDFQGTTPQGPGMAYKSKYGAVGMYAFDNPSIMDGMNEKGLSVGTFYFPGFASYSTITSTNQNKALSPVEFSNWLLLSFATIDEIKAALPQIVIAPTVDKGWGTTPPPFHYIVYDQQGNSLVIEPIDGKLVTYDNPLGTFSNSPTFDWHMTNLRNYINLTPFNVAPLKVSGIELAPFGQGSGMVGMPGDFTPPSRFVRAAIFSITATPSKNSQDAIFQGFHILHQFDIPVGIARQEAGGVIHTDYTLVTCMHNPHEMKYYFNTYDNQTIRMVDLTQFDLEMKSIKTTNSAKSAYDIDDISTKLQ